MLLAGGIAVPRPENADFWETYSPEATTTMYSLAARIVVALILLAGSLEPGLVRADVATPDAADLPDAAAPLGLGTVTLPADETAILALFDQLPDAIASEMETAPAGYESDRIVRAYGSAKPVVGPPLTLHAVNLTAGNFFLADFTVARYVALAAPVSDPGATSSGRGGDLVWIRAESTAGIGGDKAGTPEITQPIYTLAWGLADSRWLFTAMATDPAALEALVTAFVIAAGGQPATPTSDGTPIPYSR